MATIGSIVAQFTADTGGLQKGVEDAVSYFQGLRDQIAGATEDIKQFNAVLSAQIAVANAELNKLDVEKSIRIDADVSDLKTSIEEVDKLASVSFDADTSSVSSAVEEISKEKPAEIEVKADTTNLSTATGVIKQFASTSKELFSQSGEEVVEGAEKFDTFRTSAAVMASGVTKAYSDIKNASNQTANAINAIGVAASAISKTGQDGFKGFSSAVEATVIATGRAYDATETLAKTYKESLPAAASASIAGFRAFVGQLGGIDTLGRAAGGSAAATAITVGSLGGAFASAAASVGTYAAVITAAKVASAGMSEEAQAYVQRGAEYAGAFAGVAAGAAATTSAYNLVAGALYKSSTATQFFQNVLQGLGGGITTAVASSASLVKSLTQINTVMSLVSSAANEKTTGLGFVSLAARVAVTSVMFGALAGGVRAYAAGTAVAAGVTGGASAAITGLAATFPLAAVGAMAAAVATGKFFHALEHLSVATQSLDQMAERFGTTTQEMEKLKLAADNTQVSMRMLGKAQQSFYQNLSKIKSGQFNTESVREAKIAFDKLGISTEELKNKRPDEAFRLAAAELSKVEDAAKRTSIAMDLFGRTGGMILPALKELEEIDQDFARLGGALNSLDTKRLLDVEASFDRLSASGKSLGRTLLIPFVELQRAFNNFSAEVKGGLSTALAPLASMLADVSKPLSIIIEMVGRVIGIFLRMVAVIFQIAASLQAFAAFAAIFEGIRYGFDMMMKPIEDFIAGAAELASAFAAAMRPAAEYTGILSLFGVGLRAIGTAVGVVLAFIGQLAIYVGVGAAAWGIYTVAISLASATSLLAAANFALAWAAALGPIAVAALALAAIGGVLTVLVKGLVEAGKWVYGLAKSFIGFKSAPEKIDATRASVDELAEASRAASAFKGGKSPAFDEVKKSVTEAKEEINSLTIESARYGSEGSAAAKAAQEGFSELQQKLADGRITLEEFDEQTKKNAENLRENLKSYKDDSPAIALKKNLELYKQLNDAAKAATKSTRDIGAGTVIEDKFFPTSEKIKTKAAEYKAEYIKALEEIKKKQQEGFFADEIKQKKEKNQSDFDNNLISKDQFETVKLELDSTNAQEEASIAAEEVKREFDRNNKINIELDTSFAEKIRKELEDAFMSPVDKFEDELDKIKNNKSLTDTEKALARANLTKKTRESLVGKSAQTQFQERTRDVKQAAAAGLISTGELNAELKKASEDFASAVGVTKTPFETFSSSLNNIAKQFGFAGQPIDVVREKLKGNAEQLAMFDRAVKESRDNLLASLGIEKTPQQVFDEQIEKIEEAANSKDPNKSITSEQADQARAAARRKRDEALGAGADLAGQFSDRQAKINEAYGGGKDPAKLAVAQNKLDMDKRSAAGLDATPAQALKAGIDKVNDAFGVTGKSLAEIQSSLSPAEFEEYQEAIKKNKTAVEESLGIQKPSIVKLQEAQDKLSDAVGENVISQQQASSAARKLRDDFMSSIGVAKTPFEEFSGAIDNIAEQFDMAGQPLETIRDKLKGNADQLALFDRAVKTARDNLLSSLGIEKTPQQIFDEQMKKIEEAANSTDPNKKITKEQAEQARTNALRKRDEALGGESAADFGGKIKEQRAKIEEAYGKNGANDPEKFKSAMRKLNESIPGAEQQSPVQKFQEDLEKLKAAFGEGTPEFEQGKKNLQAQLQDELKPALDATKEDRRSVDASDSRSKGGVDTFFRILRGNDNPSLKAQLEVARNTKFLADAARDRDAAPVIAQLSAPR